MPRTGSTPTPTTTAQARAALVRTNDNGYMTRHGHIVYVRRVARPVDGYRWSVEVPRAHSGDAPDTIGATVTRTFLSAARYALRIAEREA